MNLSVHRAIGNNSTRQYFQRDDDKCPGIFNGYLEGMVASFLR